MAPNKPTPKEAWEAALDGHADAAGELRVATIMYVNELRGRLSELERPDLIWRDGVPLTGVPVLFEHTGGGYYVGVRGWLCMEITETWFLFVSDVRRWIPVVEVVAADAAWGVKSRDKVLSHDDPENPGEGTG